MINETPLLICLTPTKNEDWILDVFLKATSKWADFIILADQFSDDNTLKIAANYPKVIVVKNESKELDEAYRQNLLLNRARSLPGKRKVFFVLDADEILTSNYLHSEDWITIMTSKKGTAFSLPWIHVLDRNSYWQPKTKIPFIFVDDGNSKQSQRFHAPRVPNLEEFEIKELNDIGLLHLQYLPTRRNRVKQYFYQVKEAIDYPRKSAIDIFRSYNDLINIIKNAENIEEKWIEKLTSDELNIFDLNDKVNIYHIEYINQSFEKYGVEYFRKLAIWDDRLFVSKDPRSWFDKLIHKFLERTQIIRDTLAVKILQKFIKFIW